MPTMNAIIADRICMWRDREVIDLYEGDTKDNLRDSSGRFMRAWPGEAIERLSVLFHELMSLNIRGFADLAPNVVPAAHRMAAIKTELYEVLPRQSALPPRGWDRRAISPGLKSGRRRKGAFGRRSGCARQRSIARWSHHDQ